MFMNDFKVAYEKLNNQIKETRKIERQRRKEQSELENQLIKSLFQSHASLDSFEIIGLEDDDPYDGHSYGHFLGAVNMVQTDNNPGFALPDLEMDLNNPLFKSWLIECRISVETFKDLCTTLKLVRKIIVHENLIERKNYE